MGRWTLRHTDEVLVSKLESIINGAVKRLREESDTKSKPSLSYESFVESLDEEDSFTIAVIELLLKEIADRRMRPPTDDKKVISQQTSEALRSLALGYEVYQPAPPYNRFRNRSTVNLPGPPGSLYTPADSDEDDLGIGDGMGGIEGARIDSALYDVYSGGQMGNPRGYPPAPILPPSTHTGEQGTVPRPYEMASIPGRQLPIPHPNHFPPTGARRWQHVFSRDNSNTNNNGNATSLMRRPSVLRRTMRVPEGLTHAASEFSEFAARRRSSQRQLLQNRDRTNSDGPQVPRGTTARLAGIHPPPALTSYDVPRSTLFDPPSPPARDNATRVPSPSPSTEGDEAQGERTPRAATQAPGPGLLHDSRDNYDNEYWRWGGTLADWHPVVPRIPLRRGGVQPPETILPPADSILSSSSISESQLARDLGVPSSLLRPETDDAFERELRAEFDAWSANDRMFLDRQSQQEQQPSSSSVPPLPQETPASLPTPRSVSPTEENAPPAGASSSETANN